MDDTSVSADAPNDALSSEPSGDPAFFVDRDAYCLTCGYNLRGLTGNPVRCPECGDFNGLGTLRLTAPRIKAALRKMETGPVVCVACMLLALLLAPVALLPRLRPSSRMMFLTLGLLCAVAWIPAFLSTWRDFGGRRGWVRVLVGLHVAGLLLTCWWALLLIRWGAGDWISMRGPMRIVGRTFHFVRLIETHPQGWLVVIAAVALFVWGLAMHRAAKRRMATILRESAVEVARRMRA